VDDDGTDELRSQNDEMADRDLRHQPERAEQAEEHTHPADGHPSTHHVTSTRASHLVFSTPARFGAIRRNG
jgi:hypothetical protein